MYCKETSATTSSFSPLINNGSAGVTDFPSLRYFTKCLIPPSNWNTTSFGFVRRSSLKVIAIPLVRNANSRKRLQSTSKLYVVVSVKISGSAFHRIVVPRRLDSPNSVTGH